MFGSTSSVGGGGLLAMHHCYLKNELLERDLDDSYIDSTLNYKENKENLQKTLGIKLESDNVTIEKQYKKYLAAEDQIAGIAGDIKKIDKLLERV